MRRIIFQNNNIYHIYNRGVDKREIFTSDCDYIRFLECLGEFNDLNNCGSIALKRKQIVRSLAPNGRGKEPVVKIISYCLMPNHFHLLLSQMTDRGITQFMHKLGTGYTNYFNTKYERTGSLFQGTFKAVSVDNDGQLINLLRYIHLNPLGLVDDGWKSNDIKDIDKATKFLENYKWSSDRIYRDELNSEIVDKDIFAELLSNKYHYHEIINDWAIDDEIITYKKTLE